MTITFNNAPQEAMMQIIQIAGANASTPIGASGTNFGSSSSPLFNLSGSAGSYELLFGSATSGATAPTWSTTAPAAFVPVVGTNTVSNATEKQDSAVYFGPIASSATGSLSVSASWGAMAIEIKP